MVHLKHSLSILFISTVGFLIFSCRTVPDYSNIPEISEINASVKNLGIYDSIAIKLRFQDGNADLGYDPNDSKYQNQPYQLYAFKDNSSGEYDSTKANFFHFNFHVEYYLDRGNGEIELFDYEKEYGDINGLSGRFGLLASLDHSGPIDGVLTHGFRISNLSPKGILMKPNTKAYFVIKISDRAMNVSNALQTDTLLLNPTE